MSGTDRLAHVLGLQPEWANRLVTESTERGRRSLRRRHLARVAHLRTAQKIGRHKPSEWRLVLRLYGSACLRCGYHDSTKEHIRSVAVGGSDAIDNLQPLCGSCNSSKGTDTADYRWDGGEWLAVALWEADGEMEAGFH